MTRYAKKMVNNRFYGTINVDGINVVERLIIEKKKSKAYVYKINEIDEFYQSIGSSITKTKGFSTGLLDNLTKVLIVQTSNFERQTMKNWIADTPHQIVHEFTKEI